MKTSICPNSRYTTFAYDVLERLTTVISADGKARTTTYNGAANTVTVTDENSHQRTFAYRADDSLSTITYNNNVQTITIVVTDAGSHQTINGANVDASVLYASGSTTKNFTGTTDAHGQFSFSWRIGGNSRPGTFTVTVDVSASGHGDASASTTFQVIPAS